MPNNKNIVSISLNEKYKARLGTLCEFYGCGKSEIIRRGIDFMEDELRKRGVGKFSEKTYKKTMIEKTVEIQRNIMSLPDSELIEKLQEVGILPKTSQENPDKDGMFYGVKDGSICLLFLNNVNKQPSTVESWTREEFLDKIRKEKFI